MPPLNVTENSWPSWVKTCSLNSIRIALAIDSAAVAFVPVKGDSEFFTAIAANYIGPAQSLMQQSRNRLDDPIAGAVTMEIVDRFEPIQVEQRKGQRSFGSLGPAYFAFELVHERRMVQRVGEAVPHHIRADDPGALNPARDGGGKVRGRNGFG